MKLRDAPLWSVVHFDGERWTVCGRAEDGALISLRRDHPSPLGRMASYPSHRVEDGDSPCEVAA